MKILTFVSEIKYANNVIQRQKKVNVICQKRKLIMKSRKHQSNKIIAKEKKERRKKAFQ